MQKTIHCLWLVCFLLTSLYSSATVKTSATRDSLATVYTSQIGVKEATGHNDGPQVEAYQKVTGNRKGDAWCASFVSACLKYAKIPGYRNGNGSAASWFKPSHIVYQRGVHSIRNFERLAGYRGNTGSLYFTKLGRIGHIFFIDDIRGDYVITVEGNTNNGLSRDGDGVYRLRRKIRNVYSVSDHVRT